MVGDAHESRVLSLLCREASGSKRTVAFWSLSPGTLEAEIRVVFWCSTGESQTCGGAACFGESR